MIRLSSPSTRARFAEGKGALAIEPPTSVLLSFVSLLVGEAADALAWMPGACISIFVGAEEARLRKLSDRLTSKRGAISILGAAKFARRFEYRLHVR
jgi:hypothetical protein